MWTFVPKTYMKSPLAPLCCLKNCTVGNQGSQCPAPEVEQGVISGVKDPSSYGKCKGPTCFAFDVNWNSGGPSTTLPGCPMGANATPTCSVRKLEAIYYPPDGRTYACTSARNKYTCSVLVVICLQFVFASIICKCIVRARTQNLTLVQRRCRYRQFHRFLLP